MTEIRYHSVNIAKLRLGARSVPLPVISVNNTEISRENWVFEWLCNTILALHIHIFFVHLFHHIYPVIGE